MRKMIPLFYRLPKDWNHLHGNSLGLFRRHRNRNQSQRGTFIHWIHQQFQPHSRQLLQEQAINTYAFQPVVVIMKLLMHQHGPNQIRMLYQMKRYRFRFYPLRPWLLLRPRRLLLPLLILRPQLPLLVHRRYYLLLRFRQMKQYWMRLVFGSLNRFLRQLKNQQFK